ncbi:MAG: response regulator [Deltaproteobacteria bacterium]|nr:response regulator [Deltaproteobacteria bacterium]
MKNELYTVGQAAEYCSLSRGTLWRYIKSGDLKASQTPGGHFRILRKDLDAFIVERGMYPLANNLSSGKKILIVDDDPQVRDVLTQMLSGHKYETETASSGFAAGAKVATFKPGLIILDLLMPQMSGFEVCRDKIMKAGADDYMAKPLSRDAVLGRVAGLLSGKKG